MELQSKIVSFENNKSFVENFKHQNRVACDNKNEIVVSNFFVELVQRL